MSKKKKIEKRDSKVVVQSKAVISQSFSGPIPHPAMLAEYNKIVPDAAERILKMAENNSNHAIKMDQDKLLATKEYLKRGQNCGIASVIIISLICAIALFKGAYIVAGILGGMEMGSLIGAFIYDKSKKN